MVLSVAFLVVYSWEILSRTYIALCETVINVIWVVFVVDYVVSLWWAFVTVTTVGYGDFSPVTFQGKIIAVVLMFTGIALIGIVTATLASWKHRSGQSGDGPARGRAREGSSQGSCAGSHRSRCGKGSCA